MLKQRVITAVCLAAVLFLILWSGSSFLFGVFLLVFFGAASWENARLFNNNQPMLSGAVACLVFAGAAYFLTVREYIWLAMIGCAIWGVFLIPALFSRMPALGTPFNTVCQWIYWFSVLCSVLSVWVLYRKSVFFLLSVLVVIWLADIGAYFAGRTFGKHKLAPSISPGKTWEGVAGGVIAVLIAGVVTVLASPEQDNIAVSVYNRYGWIGMVASLVVLVALSILGDLLESKLKRRVGMKDSSNLLPGHGGVLDRIDSVIPTLPVALLLGLWL
ncbi:MAG: CDP-archaeol synthase [Oxalobacter sp.]|nr:CDP-archaeol synthase [Oxalobacter sp.]